MRGANLDYTGITAAQLYSTASYQAHDLTGIGLDGNNLTGVNLAGQNLTNANFELCHADRPISAAHANLTGQIFSQANHWPFGTGSTAGATLLDGQLPGPQFDAGIDLSGTTSPASNLANQNLTNADLSCERLADQLRNLSQANLTNANFAGATLTGANLTGAEVPGADFGGRQLL